MVRSLSNLFGLLVAFGLTAASLPRDAASHCQPADPTTTHHDGHQKEDTGEAGQCPHCPPIECQRHVQCTIATDLGVATTTAAAAPPAHLATPGPRERFAAMVTYQPLTPPPQIRG